MTFLALLPLAAALNAGDLPEVERVKRLTPYFSPRVGQQVALDPRELRDLTKGPKAVKAGKLRGAIRVTPPAGQCFTIQRRADEPDDRICEAKELSFTLSEIDRSGRIRWVVTTGEGDFGTEVTWSTPYRVAITTPFNRDATEPPTYQFIASCLAEKSEKGRRIKIGLFGGETWLVTLPDDEIMPPQPKALPNLFIHTTGGKTSVKDAAKAKEAEANSKAAHESGAPAPEPEHKPETPPEKPASKSEDDGTNYDEEADRLVWSVPARGAYEMGGSNFMPHGSVPPGGIGRCRYNYRGADDDPDTGRLECHDVDGFKHILLPLTCLKALQK